MCNEKPATVHFKEAYNGQIREMHLCEECAAKGGFETQGPVSLTDFLFGGESAPQADPASDKSCPVCHMRQRDFSKTSRLGCEACYETFREELEPLLEDFQKGRGHVGKVPGKAKISAGITSLRRRMDSAIVEEDFEEAAQLRDEIQKLEKGVSTGKRKTLKHS